jgi:hypothetical protein
VPAAILIYFSAIKHVQINQLRRPSEIFHKLFLRGGGQMFNHSSRAGNFRRAFLRYP